jgi:hypothetical protein
MANFTALAAARHELLRRAGLDVEADGLQDAPHLRVIVGDEVHASNWSTTEDDIDRSADSIVRAARHTFIHRGAQPRD